MAKTPANPAGRMSDKTADRISDLTTNRPNSTTTRKILLPAAIALCLTFSASSTTPADITKTGSINDGDTSTSDIKVGYSGAGTLDIDAGSTLTRRYGYIGYNSGSTGTATVSGTGSKWTNSSKLYVGNSGSGTLNIQAGGQVSNTHGYIGYNAASTGTATVTGNGSTWANSGSLYVGNSGSGTLNIQAGGQVSNINGYIGYNFGSTGTATITGIGSAWANSDSLYVTRGTLTVTNGGTVTAATLWASMSDLYGNGIITVSGAVLDRDLVFDASHGNTNTFSFGSGGTLNLTASGRGTLGVGDKGTGTLRIADGVNISSASGILGYNSGSTGTGTVTGAGSKWTNSGGLNVGSNGTGTLNIQAGGQVSNSIGRIGSNDGSIGAVTVNGPGSTWTNSDDLYVTHGTLTVTDGGSVTAATLWGSLNDLYGNGTITVSGAVLDSDLVFDASHGTTSTFSFGSGGTLNLTASGRGTLGVGDKGTGTLRIADGVSISSATGYIGYNSDSIGTARVTGIGSTWTNSGILYVGYSGSGTLNIENGGQVSSSTACIGYLPYSTGIATVTGVDSTWTNNGDFKIGSPKHDGTLRVEAGGQINNNIAIAGGITSIGGSAGKVIITGVGSKWTSTSTKVLTSFSVGSSGNGTLAIEDGGQVSLTGGYPSYVYIGTNTGSTGAVSVTGVGSTWVIIGSSSYYSSFYVGYNGTGTMSIQAGGQVDNDGPAYVGYNAGAIGTVSVIGDGSTWTTSGLFFGGAGGYSSGGSGTLNIQAGGQVNSYSGIIGYNAASIGKASVTGVGSTWTNNGTLSVGYNGSGKLTVADSGKVTATSVSANNQSAIRFNVSGNDMLVLGNATSAGGISNSGLVSFYATPFLSAGTYTAISEYAGRAMTWSGTGTYKAVGGVWDGTAHVFTVSAPTAVAAGDSWLVAAGQRVVITDAASGRRVGASFYDGTVTGSPTFSAVPFGGSDIDALRATTGFDGVVRSAWNFTTAYTGSEVMLAFDIGTGAKDVAVWHYDGGVWSPFAADMLTYDAGGIVSFTVTSFSGYAVSAAPLAGDADSDGKIDGADLLILNTNWDPLGVTMRSWDQGDFNGDGKVDGADLLLLNTNWNPLGTTLSSDIGSPIPEPATLALLALGGMAILRRKR